jgi:hypothetical protein
MALAEFEQLVEDDATSLPTTIDQNEVSAEDLLDHARRTSALTSDVLTLRVASITDLAGLAMPGDYFSDLREPLPYQRNYQRVEGMRSSLGRAGSACMAGMIEPVKPYSRFHIKPIPPDSLLEDWGLDRFNQALFYMRSRELGESDIDGCDGFALDWMINQTLQLAERPAQMHEKLTLDDGTDKALGVVRQLGHVDLCFVMEDLEAVVTSYNIVPHPQFLTLVRDVVIRADKEAKAYRHDPDHSHESPEQRSLRRAVEAHDNDRKPFQYKIASRALVSICSRSQN